MISTCGLYRVKLHYGTFPVSMFERRGNLVKFLPRSRPSPRILRSLIVIPKLSRSKFFNENSFIVHFDTALTQS